MSQLDCVEENLDGHKFQIYKLDPLKSHEGFNVLLEAVAPILGSVFGEVDSLEDLANLEKTPDKLGPLFESIVKHATADRQRMLIDLFRPVSVVDGNKLSGNHFDLIFRGDLPLMFRWLKLCVTAEWGNALGALHSGIAVVSAPTASGEKSPTA